MDINTVKQAFIECEYPFYKGLEINGNTATCTLYSIKSHYHKTITLDISNYESIIHQLSIELIKLRSQEYLETESIMNQLNSPQLFMLE
ncbi:hypothetical protein [Bacillus sp. Marseille-P3661]|uniref:hypothetical protein n=1 Tax=Bacillus sp. Marseille-P3661 TaxID=1936234 RepID=UPI000C8547F6|nr:hypothetical protein [Bacillus sp. Marseille-P3661]